MTEHDKIIVYGAMWCSDCRQTKQFLMEHHIPYEWIDITDNDEAIAFVEKINNGFRTIPTVIFPDGTTLTEPTNHEMAEKTQIQVSTSTDLYDTVIIGGGPAGLTAAIYTAREGLRTLILDESGLGGQVAITQTLDNFPGFPEGIPGQVFADRLEEQARRFQVEIVQGEQITDIFPAENHLIVSSVNQRQFLAKSVIIATGTHYKKLGVPGEWDLIGVQVHFCATCDGAFYKDKDILVIGGGNSGFEEGLFLAQRFAKSVHIVEFLPEVRASKILQEQVAQQANMRVTTNHAVKEFLVDQGHLAGILVEDRASGEVKTWQTDGIFVFVGLKPNSDFLPEEIDRDEWGFVLADENLQTSMKGVFVAGDLHHGSTKQAVAAAGEGSSAALAVRQYLQQQATMTRETNLLEIAT